MKENVELKSSRRDAIHTAFREGEKRATVVYQGQVDEISKIMFEEGCQAVLKELEIPEDHPIHQNLPSCLSPEPEPNSDPTVESPLEPAPVLPPEDAPVSAELVADVPEAPVTTK